MLKTHLHVGAGKCGSSSIQAFFTRNPHHTLTDGLHLEYCALSQHGLLRGDAIARRRRQSISGYIPSVGKLNFPSPIHHKASNQISRIERDLLFSCEGWLHQLQAPKRAFQLAGLWSGQGERELLFYMFVRPPVGWINSAWWQWGAWSKVQSFEKWLEGAIKVTAWGPMYTQINDYPFSKQTTIMPLRDNVLHQLSDSMGISRSADMDSRTNTTLPYEILSLYSTCPQLRPHPHTPLMDFVALKALASTAASLQQGPTSTYN